MSGGGNSAWCLGVSGGVGHVRSTRNVETLKPLKVFGLEFDDRGTITGFKVIRAVQVFKRQALAPEGVLGVGNRAEEADHSGSSLNI